ncbi:MAG: amidohydrolase family protein [Microbacterium sp.]|nr:amidohydrolase family protein [Microbacterium sp.]
MAPSERTVILSGTVVDGFGGGTFAGDLLIADGRVEAVVPVAARPSAGYDAHPVDAAGAIVAPGFIDIHAHSDLTRFEYPGAESRITQGITTEVIGNCGMSAAPTGGDTAGLASVIGTIDVTPQTPRPWASTRQWLDALDEAESAANVAALVGHGSVRHAVAPGTPGALDPGQLRAMRAEIADALDAGCAGVSLGLMYAPGESAGEQELRAVSQAASDAGALVAVHLRDYDARALADSLGEAAAISSGASLQLSHLRATRSDGRFGEVIEHVERMRATQDVAADCYPYIAGHTTLLQLLPPALRAGGTEAAMTATSAELAAALRASGWDAGRILVMKASRTPDAVGVCAAAQPDPWAWLAELLRANDALVDVAVESGAWEDVDLALATDWVTIGSDGTSLSPAHRSSAPHPRSWGTFPEAFRRMRAQGVGLAAAVRRMSVDSAARVGLRSGLRAGMPADVVVFAEDELGSPATFAQPALPATGICDVFVNGVRVLDGGRTTSARPGRLRRRERAA